MTATESPRYPISEEPITEGDLWWERNVKPLLARWRRDYPHLFAEDRAAPPPPPAPAARAVAEEEAA